MRYRLSKLIPMRFTTVYREEGQRYGERWWQWRDRIWRQHRRALTT
jgi:hypothetical protein